MSNPHNKMYAFGEYRLEVERRLLWRNDQPVTIGAKAYDLLLVLVENPGQPLSKDELLTRVWPGTMVEESNLTVSMSALRKVLGERRGEHQFIATLPGIGYQFVAPVSLLPLPETPETLLPVSETRFASPAIQPSVEPAASAVTTKLPASASSPTPVPSFLRLQKNRWAIGLIGGLMVLLLVGWLGWRFGGQQPTSVSQLRSLAVLPFGTLPAANEAAKEDEALGLGLADALITRLSNLNEGLVVRPTAAVQGYAAGQRDIPAIGRQLQVEAILDGRVQRSGDLMRVTLQLLRTSDGKALWAESFDEQLTNILTVQRTISERVAHALAVQLTREQRARLNKNYTENPEAFEAYLKGRYFWSKRTPADTQQAIGLFRQAIELDPAYALAWSGLADSHIILTMPGLMMSTPNRSEDFAKARAAAQKALELDDTLAEAHTSLGGVLATAFIADYEGAQREYARAIQINPNYAAAWQFKGIGYLGEGEPALALTALQRAQSLDPLSTVVYTNLGIAYFSLQRYPEAVTQLKKALEIAPNLSRAHWALGRVYDAQQQYDAALTELQTAARLSNNGAFVLSSLGHLYATLGRHAEARQLLAQVQSAHAQGQVSAYEIAVIHVGLGEHEAALALLEKQPRLYARGYLKFDPYLDPLRSHSRFAKLLHWES